MFPKSNWNDIILPSSATVLTFDLADSHMWDWTKCSGGQKHGKKRADDKTFKERAKVANFPCHWRSRLTPDPPPVAVPFWPPIRSLGFSHWRFLRKYPPPLAAHCTLISKSNKPGRLNCMSQPGVCGEVIVLTGCRWAPASPHEADHRKRH